MHVGYVVATKGITRILVCYTCFERLNGKALIQILDIREGCNEPLDITPQRFVRMLHYRPKTSQGSGLSLVDQKMCHEKIVQLFATRDRVRGSESNHVLAIPFKVVEIIRHLATFVAL